jgi:uncharacterized protein (TIGR02466 family)
MTELIDLFSVPLYKIDLDIDNAPILQYCMSVQKNDAGRSVSNTGGYQSNDLPDSPPELRELFSHITNFANDLAEKMTMQPVRIINSWVNVNGYRDFNWSHTHDDSLISGVYYVKTPENCGGIEFESPMAQLYHPFAMKSGYSKYNAPNWAMPSYEGTLYLFPAWLKHGVHPNMNKEEERVSISFNLVH